MSRSNTSCLVDLACLAETLLALDAGHPVLLTANEFQAVHERFASQANSRDQTKVGRAVEEMPRQPRGGRGRRGLWNANYVEVFKEAMIGNATIMVTIPAITQRTNREIVSFTAE